MTGTTPGLHRVLAAVATAAMIGFGCRAGSRPVTAGPGGRHEPAAVIVISDVPAEFMPNTVTVKVGDTVEWRNTGGIAHSVEFLGKAGKAIPAGTASSPSGIIAPNETYSFTFTAPGTYAYICRFHVINEMIGKIVVLGEEPASTTTTGTR